MSGAGAAARVRAHLEAEYGIRVSQIRRLGGFWSLGVMLGELHTLPVSGAGAVAARALAAFGRA
jgi:hypothetical protein